MIECGQCQNDSEFTQYRGALERSGSIQAGDGGIRAVKGGWRQGSHSFPEGFRCASCGSPVAFREKLLQAWGLDDPPIERATAMDLVLILDSLRRIRRGAEMTVREIPAAPGTYANFEALGAGLPAVLRRRCEEGLGIDLDRLCSHQVEAMGHVLAGRNVVLQTPTASGKSF
jgi:hypothetical protein